MQRVSRNHVMAAGSSTLCRKQGAERVIAADAFLAPETGVRRNTQGGGGNGELFDDWVRGAVSTTVSGAIPNAATMPRNDQSTQRPSQTDAPSAARALR